MYELKKLEEIYDSNIKELEDTYGRHWIQYIGSDERHLFIITIGDIISDLMYKDTKDSNKLSIDHVEDLLHLAISDINKKFYEFANNYKKESKDIFISKLEEVIDNRQIINKNEDRVNLLTEILRRVLSDEPYLHQLMKFLYNTDIFKEEE